MKSACVKTLENQCLLYLGRMKVGKMEKNSEKITILHVPSSSTDIEFKDWKLGRFCLNADFWLSLGLIDFGDDSTLTESEYVLTSTRDY